MTTSAVVINYLEKHLLNNFFPLACCVCGVEGNSENANVECCKHASHLRNYLRNKIYVFLLLKMSQQLVKQAQKEFSLRLLQASCFSGENGEGKQIIFVVKIFVYFFIARTLRRKINIFRDVCMANLFIYDQFMLAQMENYYGFLGTFPSGFSAYKSFGVKERQGICL